MTLKTRVDRVEAETKARLVAESEAAARRFVDWIYANCAEGEIAAFNRVCASIALAEGGDVFLARHELTRAGIEQFAADLGEPTPDDEKIYKEISERVPPELMAHLDEVGNKLKELELQ